MTQDTIQNVDANELAKFAELAHRWWDSSSEFKPLHEINPLRLDWIDHLVTLQGKRVVDVGCGGGILTEAMAARGAQVCGIDLGEKALGVARLHLLESGYEVDYQCVSAEDFAAAYAGEFDLVTCMELLEHVPDPASTVAACAALAKPGAWCIFSTINRNLKAYLYAVIGAESAPARNTRLRKSPASIGAGRHGTRSRSNRGSDDRRDLQSTWQKILAGGGHLGELHHGDAPQTGHCAITVTKH
jgi:2-polyprenyl-6-hydroxyphenyl methylase/3-demethylubiquinone-9 3-methyltransferase